MMDLGAGEGIGEEHARLVHLLLLFSLASYPVEGVSLREICLEPSMAAIQHCCSARKERKRGGYGSKTETDKWSEGHTGNTWSIFMARRQRHSDFLRYTLLGKMDKISTHTEVVWFWLIDDKSHLISELCSILKLFYGEEQWDIIQSKQSCRQVENAVAISQGMVHLSSKKQLQNCLKILILLHEAKSRRLCFSFYSSRRQAMESPGTQMPFANSGE